MTCWASWPQPIPVPPFDRGRRVVSTRRGLTMTLIQRHRSIWTPCGALTCRRRSCTASAAGRAFLRSCVPTCSGRRGAAGHSNGGCGVSSAFRRSPNDWCATSPRPTRRPDEALLTLADFLIVLREVDYEPAEGALSRTEFHEVYDTFLRELARKLGREVEAHRGLLSEEPAEFWNRVVKRCLA